MASPGGDGQSMSRVLAGAAAVVATGVSVYLWAWASRWPHSDMRDTGARFLGLVVLVAALTTVVVAWRRPGRPAVAVAVAALLASGVGLVGLHGLAQDQVEACGDHPACGSLLPSP